MKNFYKSLSMQKKLTTIVFLFTLIPIILIFVYSIVSIYHDEIDEYTANAEKRISSTINVMNRFIDADIISSDAIIKNSIVIDGIKKSYEEDIASAIVYYSDLNMFLSGFGKQIYEKFCIYPFNPTMPMGKHIEPIAKLESQTELWTKINTAGNSELVWDYKNAETLGYISFYRKINDYENLLGFFETRVYLNELIYPLRNMALEKGEVVSLKSQDGRLLYESSKTEKERYDSIRTGTLADGSIVSCEISSRNIFNKYYNYMFFFIIGFSALTVVLYFIYKRIIASVIKEFSDFIEVLQKNNGAVDNVDVESTSGDEDIAIIKKSFCDLLNKTRQMYSDIIEINRVKKAIELELLQSGINPHLLYNSLSVIRWQMLRLGQTRQAEMIDAMTDYYRRVLSGGDYIITIREELELVNKYIKINGLSYENEYTVITDIDEEVLECPTIKLIMQPFVENSILHGLTEKENGIIKIEIKLIDDDIFFTIEDNGYGMSQQAIEYAMNTEKIPKRKGGYGISNTIKRIKMYYGDEYGISIASEISKGTVVRIHIKNVDRNELCKVLGKE